VELLSSKDQIPFYRKPKCLTMSRHCRQNIEKIESHNYPTGKLEFSIVVFY